MPKVSLWMVSKSEERGNVIVGLNNRYTHNGK